MARPVDLACFDARFLALLRRFPNQMIPNACLIMPAPDASGALVFAASHNHHYLLFHDPQGFSNGVYEFGLPEDFFEAASVQHRLGSAMEPDLRLALSNIEYRLYQGSENHRVFEPSADAEITFTWSAQIAPAQEALRDAFDAILYLHQSGNSVPVQQNLSATYFSEVNFIRGQMAQHGPVSVQHRWIRLPDDSVRCLTQFNAASPEPAHVHAVVCVDADMALS